MIAPTSAPAIAPDVDTVRARWPSHATITLTAIAHGSAWRTIAGTASNASTVIRLASHNTTAAVAGTERLSSRRTGIVSTAAATSAAAPGAIAMNHDDGGGVTLGAVHHARAVAAAPPAMTNARLPPTVLSTFH